MGEPVQEGQNLPTSVITYYTKGEKAIYKVENMTDKLTRGLEDRAERKGYYSLGIDFFHFDWYLVVYQILFQN